MTDAVPVVVIPHDVDLEDRLVGRLTFRHLGYLLLAAAGMAAAVAGEHLPFRLLGGGLVIVGLAGAGWRPAGRPLDAWLLPLLRYRRRRRHWTAPVADLADAQPPEPATAAADTDELVAAVGDRRRLVRSLPRLPVTLVAAVVATAVAVGGLLAARGRPVDDAGSTPRPRRASLPHSPSGSPSHQHPIPPPPAPTADTEVPSVDDVLSWLETLD